MASYYSDIDFNFVAHPVTGDIGIKHDDDAVKQSVRNLLLTQHYERPFRSNIGSQLNRLMFDLPSPLTSTVAEQFIRNTINNLEPRADLLGTTCLLSPDNNQMYVNVVFRIRHTEKEISLSLILERTR